MNEFDEKLALYQNILEIEDWLGIKHNPQILKQVWDTMNDYYCDLQQMRDEIVYSEFEDDDEAPSLVAEDIDEAEMERQIEEADKNLEDKREKEAEEESDFYEKLPEPDMDDDFEDQKPKITDGNRISVITKDGSTLKILII